MKKFVIVLLLVILVLVMTGCGTAAVEPETLPPRDFPAGDYTEMGDGVVNVLTPSGSSENGNIPVLYLEPNTMMVQIGLEAWDFNGGALSFVYIDGMLVEKVQLANTQKALSLEGSSLSVGVHEVEVVQYSKDDPAGEIITYKTMAYEIKEKG